MTSIILEHTLYPPNVLPLSQSSYPNGSPQQNLPPPPSIYTTSRPSNRPVIIQHPPNQPVTTRPKKKPTTTRPPNQPVTTRPKKKPTTSHPTTVTLSDGIHNNPFLNPPVQQNNNNECGISTQTNNINLLISKGMKTSPGQWPWLVALFIVKLKFEFQCAGSILTNKHVITGAF